MIQKNFDSAVGYASRTLQRNLANQAFKMYAVRTLLGST